MKCEGAFNVVIGSLVLYIGLVALRTHLSVAEALLFEEAVLFLSLQVDVIILPSDLWLCYSRRHLRRTLRQFQRTPVPRKSCALPIPYRCSYLRRPANS